MMKTFPTLADAKKQIPRGGLMASKLRGDITVGGKARAKGVKFGIGKPSGGDFKNIGF